MAKAWAVFSERGDVLTFTVHRTRSGAIINAVVSFCEASHQEAKNKTDQVMPTSVWGRVSLSATQQQDWSFLRERFGHYAAKVEINEVSK